MFLRVMLRATNVGSYNIVSNTIKGGGSSPGDRIQSYNEVWTIEFI